MVQAPVQFNPEDIVRRKDWTVAQCQAVIDAGLFDLSRYELLEGELISKMAQNRPHIIVITKLIAALIRIFDVNNLQVQANFGIGQVDPNNDPQADVVVTRHPADVYNPTFPTIPNDILLVMEVSDSTLRNDVNAKARLYAHHRLQEYWIVDVHRRELIVHRNPQNGAYIDVQTYNDTQSVSPLAAQNNVARVADLMP